MDLNLNITFTKSQVYTRACTLFCHLIWQTNNENMLHRIGINNYKTEILCIINTVKE